MYAIMQTLSAYTSLFLGYCDHGFHQQHRQHALALKDANVVQEVQATVLKKALNAQADTVATLMQSVAPMAIDSTLGSRINTQA